MAKLLDKARKTLPDLEGMDDQRALRYLHNAYYSDIPIEQLAGKLGVELPKVETTTPKESAGFLRSAADLGIKGAQGVVDLGASAVGLGNLATGGMVGKGMDAIGYDPKRTNEMLGEYLSDDQKAADQAVGQAQGFTDTIGAAIQNPRAITGSVAQSMPGLLAMGGVQAAIAKQIGGRAALATAEGAAAAAGKTGAAATEAALATTQGGQAAQTALNAASKRLMGYGAATEGAQTAGSIAQNAQTEGRTWSEYAPGALAGGLGTAAIGYGAGRLVGDAATDVFTGSKTAGIAGSLPARMAKSAFSEGVLEEMPQSAQEQVFTNVALGKEDVTEGVGNASAMGLLAGSAMGGVMGGFSGKPQAPTPEKEKEATDLENKANEVRQSESVPEVGPLTQKLNTETEQKAAALEASAAAIREGVDVGGSAGDGAAGTDPANPANPAGSPGNPEETPVNQGEIHVSDASAEDQARYEAAFNEPAPAAFVAMPAEQRKLILESNARVSDGGDEMTGAQDGDILNGMGQPYKTQMAARARAKMFGPEFTAVPVFDGYVIRSKSIIQSDGKEQTAPALEQQLPKTEQKDNEKPIIQTQIKQDNSEGEASVTTPVEAEQVQKEEPQAPAAATVTQPVDKWIDAPTENLVVLAKQERASIRQLRNNAKTEKERGNDVESAKWMQQAKDREANEKRIQAEIQRRSSIEQPAQPAAIAGEGAGASQPTQAVPTTAETAQNTADSASVDAQEGEKGNVDTRQKALDRIAKGTAYFKSIPKGNEWIVKNGLKDTHELVKDASGKQWNVVEKAAQAKNDTLATAPEAKADATTETEAKVDQIVKGLTTPTNTTQVRAKAGGEYGPNGEWYQGGAFIATTDMPKKTKVVWDKAVAASKKDVVVELGGNGVAPKVEQPKVGKFAIASRISDLVRPDLPGGINETYLNYLAGNDQQLKDSYLDLIQKYKDGERWADVNAYPKQARLDDIVRMLVNGQPVAGAAIEKLAPHIREALTPLNKKADVKPVAEQAKPVTAADKYNALVRKWNELSAQYKAADEQGKAALKPEMDKLNAQMQQARGASLLDSQRQIADATNKQAAKKAEEFSVMPEGARLRPSEFDESQGIHWEKTGPDEWTGRGKWFQQDKTRTSAEMAESGGLVPMPSVSNMQTANAEPAKYELPEKVSTDWNGTAENPNAERTPRQRMLMESVAKAIDAGKYYTDEVREFVANDIGATGDTLTRNHSHVEGGDFGYDVYLARRAVEAQRNAEKAKKVSDELSLKAGDELGTLIFNDFKVTTGVKVESVSDDGNTVKFTGKRGRFTLTGEGTPSNIKSAIERATEQGKRKDGYEAFVAGRKKPNSKDYIASVEQAKQDAQQAAKDAPKETVTPADDKVIGKNDAGETLHERKDGSVYRMRDGKPDFGGDLAPKSENIGRGTRTDTAAIDVGGDTARPKSDNASVPTATPDIKAITKEDVASAENQALIQVQDELGKRTAQGVQKFGATFLPSMGLPLVKGKAKIIEAMASPKVNLQAAASELGIELPKSVNAALQAKFEGRIGEVPKAEAPIHKEPGQAPEVATPAVVTEHLTKAARNEDKKPSEMRKWLLAEIDKALISASDKQEFDDAVKRMGEKDAISMYTGNGILGKGQAAELLTFDVPGDGKFKIRNSVRGLLEFRKNVEKSHGFKDSTPKPKHEDVTWGVQKGSGGTMPAILNMIEEGDFEAAKDFAEASGVKLDDVKPPRGEHLPQWQQFLKDGTVPAQPDTKPQPAPKTAAQLDEEKRQAKEAEANKPSDTGWNMAGTGYAGKRYRGRNIRTEDGREIVARVYENAGAYEEAEVKVDGVRKFTVTDRYNAREKADAFIATLIGKKQENTLSVEQGGSTIDLKLPKPAWEMSEDELLKAVQDAGFGWEKRGKYDPMQQWIDARFKAIEQAAKDGKELPDEVLYEYRGFIRDDLSDDQADLAADKMVEVYRDTKDYGKAVQAYRDWGNKADIPEGYKPAGEPFYRNGNLIQGYAPFTTGERVSMRDAAGQSGVIEGLIKPDANGVFESASVKFDNGVQLAVPFAKLDAEQLKPFEHSGLKINQQRIKVGDEVKSRWVVQSPENAERAAKGERQIGGDAIVDSREEAVKTAERETARYEAEKARKAEFDKQEQEVTQQAEAKKEANRKKTLLERRADAILDKPTNLPPQAGLGTGTRRESMDKAISQDRFIEQATAFDSAAKKKDTAAVDLARAKGYILGLSNENIPEVKAALEAQARLKENKYEKPEYRVYSGSDRNGSFYEISKTEYDYAQSLKKENPAEDLSDYVSTSEQVAAAKELLQPLLTGDSIAENDVKALESLLKIPYLRGFDSSTARRILTILDLPKSTIEKVMKELPSSLYDISEVLAKVTGEKEKKKAFDAAFAKAKDVALTNPKVKELLYIYSIYKAQLDDIASKRGLYGVKWAERNISKQWVGQRQKLRDVQKRIVDAVNASSTKSPKKEKAPSRDTQRAEYFTPGNIVQGYGGLDEVLAYNAPDDNGRWSVKVQSVRKVDGQWVREGKPQDARLHSTEPSPADYKRGPLDKLGFEAGSSVKYTEPMKDGQAFPNAQDRGVKPEPKSTPIGDFGEKIGGAKKDTWTGFKDDLGVVSDDSIAQHKLSEIWPVPDYQKLLDGGMDAKSVAVIRSLRDEIPSKPRNDYKLKRWVEQVKTMRDLATNILNNKDTGEGIVAQLEKGSSQMRGLAGRVQLYMEVGHEKSLEGIRLLHHHYSFYRGRENVSLWVVERDAAATAFSNWPQEIAIGDTKEDAIAAFKARYSELDSIAAVKKASYDIFTKTGVKGYFIGKKIGRNVAELMGPFDSLKEARAYRQDNLAALDEKLAKYKEIPKERRDSNEPRVGEDMRNGQDVTAEMFAESFGFRGVEFGNWVEQKRRQKDLNDAFDALMDMAAIMGVPAKALSLNGELGLAFGARGSGGVNPAAAHYESDKVVINLTKREGAGSLGHEWWHAMDNYFSRQRGLKTSPYMTTATDVGLSARGSRYEPYPGVRKEMIDAFGEVMKAIRSTGLKERSSKLDTKRSKEYWTTGEEMAARSFESYLIAKLQDQNASNDYLANVVDQGAWDAMAALGMENENSYPYPTESEMPAVRAGFDKFFQTLQTKPTENGNVAMFSRGTGTGISKQSALNYVAEIASKWANSPDVFVVSDMNDPMVPQAVKDIDEAQRSGGALGDPEGFHYQGTVYVVASQVSSREDVARVVMHESLGHYGLRGVFGKALGAVLDQIVTFRRTDVNKKAAQYGLLSTLEAAKAKALEADPTLKGFPLQAKAQQLLNRDLRVAAEEVLAEMSQTRPEIGFVKRAIAAIRQWLRANMPFMENLRMTDDEIIRRFIMPARAFVEHGGQAGVEMAREVAFSRGDKAVAEALAQLSEDRLMVMRAVDEQLGKPVVSESVVGNPAPAFAKKSDQYVTVDEIGQMYNKAWGDLKKDSEYQRLDAAVERVEREYSDTWRKVADRAVEILKSKPAFSDIADKFDERQMRSLAQVYMTQAQEDVRLDRSGVEAALKKRQAYQEKYFKEVAKIPEPRPYAEEANQGRSYYTSPEFKRWFKESKAVDKNGNPLVAFHVTTRDFSTFDTEAGATKGQKSTAAYSGQLGSWFTAPSLYRDNYDAGNAESAVEHFTEDDAGGHKDGANMMLVHLSIQNPMEYSDFESMLEDRDSYDNISDFKKGLVDQGYDGIVIRNSDTDGAVDRDDWVAFYPTQIKSAIGNNGQFDPENPDIRFSRSLGQTIAQAANNVREVALPASYTVGDFFDKAPGALNWWHKTVGTQYNLAQRFPAFKRVFDSVQNFLNDVSYYATEAADKAPSILPKLESWKDLTKTPIKPEDAKAIAAPIFEGTLTWMRDESGKLVTHDDMLAAAATLTVDQKAQRLLRNDKVSDKVLQMWQGLPIEQYEAIINAKYERDMLKAGVVFTNSELKKQFGLNDEQIKLYREFRAATDKSLTDMTVAGLLRIAGKDAAPIRDVVLESKSVTQAAETLRDYLLSLADVDPERSEALTQTANQLVDKATQVQDLMDRGYAPLTRYGQYSLDVVDADGERVYFGLFESKAEAARMQRRLQSEYPNATFDRGTISQEAYKLFNGVSPETLELFGEILGLDATGSSAKDQAFQTYLKQAKSNRSAMKRLIHRKGTAGFSQDVGRVLAGFVYSNARQTASSLHMGEMSEAAEAIPQGQGELKDAAIKLVDYIKNPIEEAQAIRGMLFAQYIGGSVASAMVNITQPFTMTFPWLSQFAGVTGAGKAMGHAMKYKGGDKRLDAALKRAEEDGTVSPQEVHQLVAQSAGRGSLESGDGTRMGNAAAAANNAFSRISLGWGKLFGLAEQYNRRVTFIAAYQTALEKGIADPDGFARRAIAETQGTYNKGNKPQWARGAIGSTLFTFKQYSINYVEMLERMAKSGPEGRKAAVLALAVLFLMSGAGGLPGADDLDDLVSGVMQRLGYNFNSKSARRAFFAKYLGNGGAEFMERGVSGIAGVPIDVSGRLGMGNLIPATGLLQKKDSYGRDVAEIAGPAGDLLKRAFESSGKVLSGEILGKSGAAATILPKAVQNAWQAVDMASTGMYRDATGKKVIETDGFDAVAKAIGFQPNDVKRVQDASFETQRMISLNKLRETEIADKWALGIFENDPDKVQKARQSMKEWNEANPESRIRIDMAQIRKRVIKMRQGKAERIAATAPKEIRAEVRRDLERTK